MVKNYRTRRVTEADSRRFASKAQQYRAAMQAAYTQGLWDVAVSNSVHAVILMANALTIRKCGEYYIGQDHGQASDYLEHVLGSTAAKHASQMGLVLSQKGLVEYESRACTEKEATSALKRAERNLP